MYPPKFDYKRATSEREAIQMIKESDGKFLAGGHSLIPAMNLRLADPGTLVDISRVPDLKGIWKEDHVYYIGSMTTHAMVAGADQLPKALTEAAGMIGDPQVRNRGTVGGNVAHADPASDLPTVLMALRAQFRMVGPNGPRNVDADNFFVDYFQTALADDELLIGCAVFAERQFEGSAYAKMFNPASRYAMVGAAASVTLENGNIRKAGVAVGGLVPKATRANAVEAALVGKPANSDTIEAAAKAIADDLGDDVMGDMHASADYRRMMAPVFVRRAIETAVERAS